MGRQKRIPSKCVEEEVRKKSRISGVLTEPKNRRLVNLTKVAKSYIGQLIVLVLKYIPNHTICMGI